MKAKLELCAADEDVETGRKWKISFGSREDTGRVVAMIVEGKIL